MFGTKGLFSKEPESDEEILKRYEEKSSKDHISTHQGPGHTIIDGPKILGKGGQWIAYKMCKECCREVYGVMRIPGEV